MPIKSKTKKFIIKVNTDMTEKLNNTLYYIPILIISALILVFISKPLTAQDIKKDITIVKPYQPSVQEFYKINLMPIFNDTINLNPQFSYNINTVKVMAPYNPRPIAMATIAPETVPTLFNNYMILGIGNPWAPNIEASFNNGRSKNSAIGVTLSHQSAKGSVRVDNTNSKIDAPYSNNSVDIYGKYLLKKSALNGDISYTSNKYYFYGITAPSHPYYKKDTFDQYLQKGRASITFKSLSNDSSHIIYDTKFNYHFLADNFGNYENYAGFSAEGGKMLKTFYAGANISNYYYASSGNNDSSKYNLFTLRPYLIKAKNEWKLQGGLNISSDKDLTGNTLYVFPFAKFDFTILPQVLKISLSYDGYVRQNSYSKLIAENPFVKPGTFARNSSCNSSIDATISGSLSNEIQYSLAVDYQNIKNQIFFTNTVDSPFYNMFEPVYDDVELINVSTAVNFQINEKTNLNLTANYNYFDMLRQKKPWGVPIFNVSGFLTYNLHNKIISTTQLYIIGPRYSINPTSRSVETLKAFVDLNEKIEYRYTGKFSIFLEIKNLTATKYEYWNQYASYRFQLQGGIIFLF
jgi:hypothetical protein